MTELLAPAGSPEAFTAALEGGADAIYLGGRMFGARHYAANFSDEELAAAVRDAHLRGVAVYVTVNTLLDDGEIPELIAYLRHLYSIHVDAIIVQDLGVARIARQVTPHLELHGSTQMTVHNLSGVEFLAEQGFSRVVLAREVSLEDIRHICRHATIGVETFIHGALCIAYSGQCLMSSMIGGRSGNRGKCAQPCRLPYNLVDSDGETVLASDAAGEFLLSPKDFCGIEVLPQLIEAGVIAFKIEGRMKRAEYVAVVVDSYRRAMDAYAADKAHYAVPEEDPKNMAQAFNRGFTTGFLEGHPGKEMMSDRRPNNRGTLVGRVVAYNPQERTADIRLEEPLAVGDIIEFWVKVGGRANVPVPRFTLDGLPVDFAPEGAVATVPVDRSVKVGDRVFKTYDSRLMEKAKSFFAGASAVRRIPIIAKVEVSEGQPLRITLTDPEGNIGQGETGFLAEKALKRPLDEETIAKQVGRLGTTVFAMDTLECHIDGVVMVPVSEINEARRQAVEGLETARLTRFSRPPLTAGPSPDKFLPPSIRSDAGTKAPKLVVSVDTLNKAAAALENGADILLFGGESYAGCAITADDYRQAVALARKAGKEVVLNTPRIVMERQMKALVADLALFAELAPDAVSAANLGTLRLLKDYPSLKIRGDYSLNIFNSVTIDFFAGLGLTGLTLSPELNFGQVEQLAGRFSVPLECLVHGHLPLMISEYCAIGSFLGDLHTGSCNNACQRGEFRLKDRKGETFPLATDQFCRMHVLNGKELSLLPHVSRLRRIGIQRLRFEAKAASVAHVAKITRLYRELIDQGEDHPLMKNDGLRALEQGEITRGHYFRGVL
ncbi:MAG: DUF3656 domain-containing protein [Negativicutes bacterium]|nr:DUF3656 domain-containing protein [Negativicutes bacterium]